MKATEPPGNASNQANVTASSVATVKRNGHSPYRYTKVHDGRKQSIRGLWERNGKFVARVSVESVNGTKAVKWIPLGTDENPVTTVAQAREALAKLKVQRADNALPVIGRTPKFGDYVDTYKRMQTDKRPSTVAKEHSALKLWVGHMGGVRIDKIRKATINAFVENRLKDKISPRTVNLDVIALRNVIKRAIDDDYIKESPLKNFRPLKHETRRRSLVTMAQINALCDAAFQMTKDDDDESVPVTKNAQQFSDYVKLMAFCGSRRDETLRLQWSDVDFERGQLTIGADGLSKNRKPRTVDFNSDLEAHLKAMHARRAPDSIYLFPSPQRGDKDASSKTFKESLNQARHAAGMLKFGFHDCRHFFISHCAMAGVDFVTLSKWVGHQDGGVLIGRVYGHLADDHRKRMAQKIAFTPRIVESNPAPATLRSRRCLSGD